MKADEIDVLAAEYVLGTLEPEARSLLQSRLGSDPALRQAVKDWEDRLSGLSTEQPPLAPPEGFWDKLSSALDESDAAAKARYESLTVRRDEGEWEDFSEGVKRKFLFKDKEEGAVAFLMKFEPGAVVRAHDHPKTEECLMLEGDVTIGKLQLFAGDFHIARAGEDHPDIRSENGALLYIRGALRQAA